MMTCAKAEILCVIIVIKVGCPHRSITTKKASHPRSGGFLSACRSARCPPSVAGVFVRTHARAALPIDGAGGFCNTYGISDGKEVENDDAGDRSA